MEKRTRPMRDSWLIQSIIVGLTIVVLGAGTASGAPPIPVTTCPQNLDVAGGSYILTGNLSCVGTALTISANDVKLSLNGFTLTGDGTGSGIEVDSVSGARIRGGTVVGFGNGIRLSNATSVRVSNMVVTRNGDGVQLQSSDNNRINDSVITDNTIGVRVEDSDSNTVSTNTVSNNRADPTIAFSAGVLVQNGSTSNIIASNVIGSNGDVGVTIQGSNGNFVQGNTVNDTTDLNGNRRPGITVVSSSSTTVRGNTATGNSFGIELAPGPGGATGNLVQGNTANGNTQGILVLCGATSNTITLNTATANSDVDMNDGNSSCDSNAWTSNTFATDLVAGVPDGGPGVGCIQ